MVFYGSQTGTAEEFANRLAKDAQRYGMKGMAADPEEYDMVLLAMIAACLINTNEINQSRSERFYSFSTLLTLVIISHSQSELSRLKEIPNSMAVFCMATYGEGDPTDNAQEFYDWMQGTDDDLEGVNFAVSNKPTSE